MPLIIFIQIFMYFTTIEIKQTKKKYLEIYI